MLYKSILSKINNESLAMLGLRIIETVNKSGIEQALNGKQFLVLTEVSNRYQLAVGPRNQQLFSKAITERYNTRRDLYNSIYVYVTGLQNSPNADMQAAANEVFAVLNMYGRYFGNLKIADQSLRFIRIVEALKKPELVAALQKTLLTEKVAELDLVQREYEDLYMGRGNDRLGVVSASAMRKEFVEAIKLHVEEVFWMAKQADTEAWKVLSATIEARIGEMKVSAARVKKSETTDTTLQVEATNATGNLQSA